MECMTMEKIAPNVTAPKGFLAAGVKAGIKKSGKEDVAIIYSEVPAAAAGVFTTNTMAAVLTPWNWLTATILTSLWWMVSWIWTIP